MDRRFMPPSERAERYAEGGGSSDEEEDRRDSHEQHRESARAEAEQVHRQALDVTAAVRQAERAEVEAVAERHGIDRQELAQAVQDGRERDREQREAERQEREQQDRERAWAAEDEERRQQAEIERDGDGGGFDLIPGEAEFEAQARQEFDNPDPLGAYEHRDNPDPLGLFDAGEGASLRGENIDELRREEAASAAATAADEAAMRPDSQTADRMGEHGVRMQHKTASEAQADAIDAAFAAQGALPQAEGYWGRRAAQRRVIPTAFEPVGARRRSESYWGRRR